MSETAEILGKKPRDRGAFMETSSGKRIYIRDPLWRQVEIMDIAYAVSRQCRFAGNIRRDVAFYSVAEHLVLLARHVYEDTGDAGLALQVLMHDAHEAYVQDLIAPMKAELLAYHDIEDQHQAAVCRRFGLPYPLDPRVRMYDLRMLLTEREQVMIDTGSDWGLGGFKPLPITIAAWAPHMARVAFLKEFDRLMDLRDEAAQ